MADTLSHLVEAMQIIRLVADNAGIQPPEVRMASRRDAFALLGAIRTSDSGRMILATPLVVRENEFTVGGIKFTWPE